MKNLSPFFRLAFSLFLSLLLVSCDDDDAPTNIVQFQNSTLSGAEEVPANSAAGTGTFSGSYNKDTKILSYTITFSGLTPTNMHFHKGDVGVSGPVVIPISSAPYNSPITTQTPALDATQEADLLAGKWYVNIHTSQFPAGQIRGQVKQ